MKEVLGDRRAFLEQLWQETYPRRLIIGEIESPLIEQQAELKELNESLDQKFQAKLQTIHELLGKHIKQANFRHTPAGKIVYTFSSNGARYEAAFDKKLNPVPQVENLTGLAWFTKRHQKNGITETSHLAFAADKKDNYPLLWWTETSSNGKTAKSTVMWTVEGKIYLVEIGIESENTLEKKVTHIKMNNLNHLNHIGQNRPAVPHYEESYFFQERSNASFERKAYNAGTQTWSEWQSCLKETPDRTREGKFGLSAPELIRNAVLLLF